MNTTTNFTGTSFTEHFLMHLFCGIPQGDPRQKPIFDKGGKVDVKILLDGIEMPDPLGSLESFIKRVEEHYDGLASKRALELVNSAGLDKIRETISQCDWQLREKLREAGARFDDES